MDILKILMKVNTYHEFLGMKNNTELIKSYEKFWDEIRHLIYIRNYKSNEYYNNYFKIKIDSDYDLPL